MTGRATSTACARLLWVLLAALLTACAAPRQATPGQSAWSGRLAVLIASTPPQSFSAGFDLTGTPEAGELSLTSPLGTTLATVAWAPGRAELHQGQQITRRASLEALTTDLGGTALPVTALFAWLSGQHQSADGWEADLTQHSRGRITARRSAPLPDAELRIVFQP